MGDVADLEQDFWERLGGMIAASSAQSAGGACG